VKGLLNLEPVQEPAPGPMEGLGVRLELTQDDELSAVDELAETKPQWE
jgi:hypothetical protein